MKYTTVDLTPRIGAEVKADLETLLSGEIAGELKALLMERGVLTFRGHSVTPEQQLQFAGVKPHAHAVGAVVHLDSGVLYYYHRAFTCWTVHI